MLQNPLLQQQLNAYGYLYFMRSPHVAREFWGRLGENPQLFWQLIREYNIPYIDLVQQNPAWVQTALQELGVSALNPTRRVLEHQVLQLFHNQIGQYTGSFENTRRLIRYILERPDLRRGLREDIINRTQGDPVVQAILDAVDNGTTISALGWGIGRTFSQLRPEAINALYGLTAGYQFQADYIRDIIRVRSLMEDFMDRLLVPGRFSLGTQIYQYITRGASWREAFLFSLFRGFQLATRLQERDVSNLTGPELHQVLIEEIQRTYGLQENYARALIDPRYSRQTQYIMELYAEMMNNIDLYQANPAALRSWLASKNLQLPNYAIRQITTDPNLFMYYAGAAYGLSLPTDQQSVQRLIQAYQDLKHFHYYSHNKQEFIHRLTQDIKLRSKLFSLDEGDPVSILFTKVDDEYGWERVRNLLNQEIHWDEDILDEALDYILGETQVFENPTIKPYLDAIRAGLPKGYDKKILRQELRKILSAKGYSKEEAGIHFMNLMAQGYLQRYAPYIFANRMLSSPELRAVFERGKLLLNIPDVDFIKLTPKQLRDYAKQLEDMAAKTKLEPQRLEYLGIASTWREYANQLEIASHRLQLQVQKTESPQDFLQSITRSLAKIADSLEILQKQLSNTVSTKKSIRYYSPEEIASQWSRAVHSYHP